MKSEARTLRELAEGHRDAGRESIAEQLEAKADGLDGGGGGKKEGGPMAKKKTKKKGKKSAGKRATSKGKKGRKKARSAKQKAATKKMIAANKAASRTTNPKKGKKRAGKKAGKKTGNIRATNPTKKKGKARKKNPTKAASGPGAPPHPGSKKGKSGGGRKSLAITKAQREAALGDTANVYLDLRTGKSKTKKQVARTKNPSGGWWSALLTVGGVCTGVIGAEFADRGIATMLTAKEIEEVEGDGAKQQGAQGRDAMRRILQKPGWMRIAAMLGVGGFFLAGSAAASAMKWQLFSDFLIGNAGGAVALTVKKVVWAYFLPALPGKVKDGPEVTWQNRFLPEYQEVPQEELEKYLKDPNHLPQIIDSETNRMDGRERYDRMGMPFDLQIEHEDANASGSVDVPSGGVIDVDGKKASGAAGLGALMEKRKAALNTPAASRVMASRAGAQAAARDYEERFKAPGAVGACCDSCRANKPCEADCDEHSVRNASDVPTPPIVNTSAPPEVKFRPKDDMAGTGPAAPPEVPASPQQVYEVTRPQLPAAFMVAPTPSREAAILLRRVSEPVGIYGRLGNIAPPPPRYPGRRSAA